jgi:hypothetical protein
VKHRRAALVAVVERINQRCAGAIEDILTEELHHVYFGEDVRRH